MKICDKGLALLREFEGCKLLAYKDGGGVWTIGFGHTEGVKRGDNITQEQAEQILKLDLESRERRLTALLEGTPTSQEQFSALLCLVFNIGFGDPNHKPKPIAGLLTSTVLKRHRLGNHTGAAKAFGMWIRDNGKIVNGLIRRRAAEAKLYLGQTA